jgi:hypothetical protein
MRRALPAADGCRQLPKHNTLRHIAFQAAMEGVWQGVVCRIVAGAVLRLKSKSAPLTPFFLLTILVYHYSTLENLEVEFWHLAYNSIQTHHSWLNQRPPRTTLPPPHPNRTIHPWKQRHFIQLRANHTTASASNSAYSERHYQAAEAGSHGSDARSWCCWRKSSVEVGERGLRRWMCTMFVGLGLGQSLEHP